MSVSNDPSGATDAAADAQLRQIATFGHLMGLLNLVGIPFGGVVGTAFLYFGRKGDPPFVRDNVRNALNAQILLFIVYAVMMVFFLVFWFIGFAGALAAQGHAHGPGSSDASFSILILAMFGLFFLSVVVTIGTIVNEIIAAMAANRGEIGRYVVSFPFIK